MASSEPVHGPRYMGAEFALFIKSDASFLQQCSSQTAAKMALSKTHAVVCVLEALTCSENIRSGSETPLALYVVRASRAAADHVAIRGRVEDRSHGRVGDVRDGSRIRSHQDARETRSRAAGAELRGP